MTVDYVTKVINQIGDQVDVMDRGGLDIPKILSAKIEKRYSTDSEKSHAYAHYYVHIHPNASWEHLTEVLCCKKELTAAKESKSHMSTGKCC